MAKRKQAGTADRGAVPDPQAVPPVDAAVEAAVSAAPPAHRVKRTKPAADADTTASPARRARPKRPPADPVAAHEPATPPAHPALAAPVRIFQIYYEPWHRDLLDPAFVPLDNGGNRTELLEFDIFERLARAPHVDGASLWGALSWRFREKTGLSGGELLAAIDAAPGADVYFCNPFPANEALYHNLWCHGETAHPNFLVLSRAFLIAAGFGQQEADLMEPSTSFSCANYFVGNRAFWDAYLPFVRRAVATADARLPEGVRAALHSTDGDDRGLHAGSSYLPFIVERLLPLFLRSAGKSLRAQKLVLPFVEQDLTVHHKLLRDMKDVAVRTRSPWLAACWVNYRNLFLTQQHKGDWARKYLRAVTPAEIRFPDAG